MKVVLHIKNRAEKSEQELVFDRLPLLFGRSKICDVVLADPTLSRQQCTLEVKDVSGQKARLRLTDLDSANGTFFDGQRIKDQLLDAGQMFRIGDVEVKILRLDLYEEALIEQSIAITERMSQKTDSVSGPTNVRSIGSKSLAIQSATKSASISQKKGDAASSPQELTLKTPTVLRKKQVAPSF